MKQKNIVNCKLQSTKKEMTSFFLIKEIKKVKDIKKRKYVWRSSKQMKSWSPHYFTDNGFIFRCTVKGRESPGDVEFREWKDSRVTLFLGEPISSLCHVALFLYGSSIRAPKFFGFGIFFFSLRFWGINRASCVYAFTSL